MRPPPIGGGRSINLRNPSTRDHVITIFNLLWIIVEPSLSHHDFSLSSFYVNLFVRFGLISKIHSTISTIWCVDNSLGSPHYIWCFAWDLFESILEALSLQKLTPRLQLLPLPLRKEKGKLLKSPSLQVIPTYPTYMSPMLKILNFLPPHPRGVYGHARTPTHQWATPPDAFQLT